MMDNKYASETIASRIGLMALAQWRTVADVLREAGVSSNTVDNMRKGSMVSADKLHRISRVLGTSVETLLLGVSNVPEDVMTAFAERLTKLLEERGLTQYRLSKLTGISEGTITGWIKGGKNPAWKSTEKIAKCLGVTPNELMGAEQLEATLDDVLKALLDIKDALANMATKDDLNEIKERLSALEYTGNVTQS
jgi:transcriptional regulator with XRE-family HTH domain